MDRLTQQIALLKRHNLYGAVLFLNLDHFKHINDSLGHPVGAAVLKMSPHDWKAADARKTRWRLGGDEFMVLIYGLEGSRTEIMRQARKVAETLRHLLAEPILVDGHRLQATPSIGTALVPTHGDNPTNLLKRADIALYGAKDSGRNAIQIFRNSMQEAASERLRLENDLRLAQARDEFELHFQPQVNAQDGRVIGSEALLRWNMGIVAAGVHHRLRGVVQPRDHLCTTVRQIGSLLDRQGIHISVVHHHRPRAVAQDTNHSGNTDPGSHLEPCSRNSAAIRAAVSRSWKASSEFW